MPGVDQHERQVGVARRPAAAPYASWFGKTCSSKTQPELGELREVLVERTDRASRSGRLAKRNASCSCQCSCSRQPRISGEASACASSVSSASGANRSAEPTIACGQPVRSCCSWTHSTSSTRVLQRPVGLHVDGLREAVRRARRRRTPRPCRPCPAATRRGRRCAGSSARSATAGPWRAPDVVMRVDVVHSRCTCSSRVGRSRAPARRRGRRWIAAIAARDRAVRRGRAPSGDHHSSRCESRASRWTAWAISAGSPRSRPSESTIVSAPRARSA